MSIKVCIPNIKFAYLIIFFLLGGFLSGCASIIPEPTKIVFQPPTLAFPVEPLVSPTATLSPPTPTPSCFNYLRFIQDNTIPDGTVVAKGQSLDKRWLVENSGTCNWDQSYTIRLITGPDLDANPIQALFPARANTQFVLQILYTAPEKPGIYRSAWQAFDEQENPFGDPVFIEILVQ